MSVDWESYWSGYVDGHQGGTYRDTSEWPLVRRRSYHQGFQDGKTCKELGIEPAAPA